MQTAGEETLGLKQDAARETARCLPGPAEDQGN